MTAQLQVEQLTFRPGQTLPTISSNRAALAGVLLRGKSAQAAPQQLPRLYALCGEAHRLTAQLAIDAARGLRTHATTQELSSLAAETAREHVRRIWIDWPRLIGRSDKKSTIAALQSLRDCPLFGKNISESSPIASVAFRAWVETAVLGESVPEWLARWQTNPNECMLTWVARAITFPAKLLRDIEYDAIQIQTFETPLLPHADRDALYALAQNIAKFDDFDRAPTSEGNVCETGIGTRLAGMDGNRSSTSNAWLRLGARIAELALLSGEALDNLALGSLMLAPGEALAWSEMARGLLLHWVRLEQAAPLANIVDYRIVAPTEWNFHPSGVVAKALAVMPTAACALSRAQAVRHIGILAAAFDPCVTYKIEFEHA